MNARLIELIKAPELIQPQDLSLLNAELQTHPYLQSLRALRLSLIHTYQPENYADELSVTAAYTTDKKILYQFINKEKFRAQPAGEEPINDEKSCPEPEKVRDQPYNDVPFSPPPTLKTVEVDGEPNRILFEGEEDFLERESGGIDLEATLESGKIVHQSAETLDLPIEETPAELIEDNLPIETAATVLANETDPKNSNSLSAKSEAIEEKAATEKNEEPKFEEAAEAENFSREKVIEPENLTQPEKEEVAAEVSFHALDEFLPEVKVTPKHEVQARPQPVAKKRSRHEEEMEKLIAEVEARLKASKKTKPAPEPEVGEYTSVNFAETQEFQAADVDVESETAPPPAAADEEQQILEKEPRQVKSSEFQETSQEWQPMKVVAETPDALIQSASATGNADEVPKVQPDLETKPLDKKEKSEDVAPATASVESSEEANVPTQKGLSTDPVPKSESNVPSFLNTWQTWLKIDRTPPAEIKQEIPALKPVKSAVIEQFLEKEPRISKLREDSDFVAKERGDNISHLMTETLAQLYVDQKLYSKAIKAYKTLTEKFPEKTEVFNEKIQQIRDSRKPN